MNRKLEPVFSLILFFFASFFFISILSSIFIDSFEDLAVIILRYDGLFVNLTRIMMLIGICTFIYFFKTNYVASNTKYNAIAILGVVLFISILILTIVPKFHKDDSTVILDNYIYTRHDFVLWLKELIVDALFFIYFVVTPIFVFFYRKQIYTINSYNKFINSFLPSFDVSLIFLFAYSIRSYNSSTLVSLVDLIVIISVLLIYMRIMILLRHIVSFHNLMTLMVVTIGIIINMSCSFYLKKCDLYCASLFFYSIGLLYWFFDISDRAIRQ